MNYSVYLRRYFMNEIDRLVYLAIAYSSCFSFALNRREIFVRLPLSSDLNYLFDGENHFQKKILISEQKINKSLKKLLELSLIKTDGEYFFLQKKDLLNRKQKAFFYHSKMKEAERFASLASKIPLIQAIALTGSAAVANANQKDDLDFMVICKKNSLWLTRFLLILLIKFMNKRPGKKRDGAWCVNLFLDENDLALDENKRTLYEAYEILQMCFIFDRQDYQDKFLAANQWLKNFLQIYLKLEFKQYFKQPQKSQRSLINQVFFYLQKTYRCLIFGQENFVLSLTQAFFNQANFKNKLRKKLAKKLLTKN